MAPTTTDFIGNRVTISLPNMFKSFLVMDPVVNPYYEAVRAESEGWLQSTMHLSPKESKRVHYCDFSYFVAVLIPHAPKESLKIASDWGNWVFMFDDMFDEGELRNDPDSAQRIILNLLSVMVPDAERTSEQFVVTAHDSIYRRLSVGSSSSILRRYVAAMKAYCAGALQHVEDFAADRMPTVSEMLLTRRMSIGVFPMYPLIEFAYGLSLPDEVFLHPTIQKLEILGAEFVMLMNDILSYRKEETEDCPFNTVAVCRVNGASAQNAFDEIASMVDARFSMWNEAVKTLPTWGEDVDAQLRQYIEGIQNIVQANISWSFRTGRYFGPKAEMVRQSREIDVLVQPSFLSV